MKTFFLNSSVSIIMLSSGQSDSVTAYQLAKKAEDDCTYASGSVDLDINIPDSISQIKGTDSTTLSDAVQEVGLWEVLAEQSMTDTEKIIQSPNDIASAADFKTSMQKMDSISSSINGILVNIANSLGIKHYQPIDFLRWQKNQ